MKKKTFLLVSIVSSLLVGATIYTGSVSTNPVKAVKEDVIHTVTFNEFANALPEEAGNYTFYNEVGTPIPGEVVITTGTPVFLREDDGSVFISGYFSERVVYVINININGVSKVDSEVAYTDYSSYTYKIELQNGSTSTFNDDYKNLDATSKFTSLEIYISDFGNIWFQNLVIEYSETQCRLMSK